MPEHLDVGHASGDFRDFLDEDGNVIENYEPSPDPEQP